MFKEIEQILNKLSAEVLAKRQFSARTGIYYQFPNALDSRVIFLARKKLPQGLYGHQLAAVQAALSGKHVALTTSTASGKSAAFLLPVLDNMFKTPTDRSIYITPIKALGNDQWRKFEGWGINKVVARYDGDTKKEEREEALRRKRLLISTPDVLHMTLLRRNNESLLNTFFANLRYIILDECHVYNGVFGSHASMLFRRLRQVCRNHGSNPQFIFASATLGNPEIHFESLTGLKDVHIITEEQNTSPQAEKVCWLVRCKTQVRNWTKKLVGELLKTKKRLNVLSVTFGVISRRLNPSLCHIVLVMKQQIESISNRDYQRDGCKALYQRLR